MQPLGGAHDRDHLPGIGPSPPAASSTNRRFSKSHRPVLRSSTESEAGLSSRLQNANCASPPTPNQRSHRAVPRRVSFGDALHKPDSHRKSLDSRSTSVKGVNSGMALDTFAAAAPREGDHPAWHRSNSSFRSKGGSDGGLVPGTAPNRARRDGIVEIHHKMVHSRPSARSSLDSSERPKGLAHYQSHISRSARFSFEEHHVDQGDKGVLPWPSDSPHSERGVASHASSRNFSAPDPSGAEGAAFPWDADAHSGLPSRAEGSRASRRMASRARSRHSLDIPAEKREDAARPNRHSLDVASIQRVDAWVSEERSGGSYVSGLAPSSDQLPWQTEQHVSAPSPGSTSRGLRSAGGASLREIRQLSRMKNSNEAETEKPGRDPRKNALLFETAVNSLFDIEGPEKYESELIKMELMEKEKTDAHMHEMLDNAMKNHVNQIRAAEEKEVTEQSPSAESQVQCKFKKLLTRATASCKLRVAGRKSLDVSTPEKTEKLDGAKLDAAASEVLLERRLEAVYASFALFGEWEADKMALPQETVNGIGGLKFLKLCQAARLVDNDTVTPEAIRTLFLLHRDKETNMLPFPGFLVALGSIADLNFWSPKRIFESVLRVNGDGHIAIHSRTS